MIRRFKNTSTARLVIAVAAVLAANHAAWAVGVCDLNPLYCYEAESATTKIGLSTVNTTSQGNSGTGYVTDFTDPGDYFEMNVNAPAGVYELWVGYRSSFGDKGYKFRVGNEYGMGTLEQSSTFKADRAGLFNLAGGTTTLGIYKDWGYHDIDYLQFKPYTPPAIQSISPQLSDPLANQNTQMLMNYLTGIYGHQTLAGHQHDASKNLAFPSSTYLNLSGGLKPAIRSSDFIEYSPTRRMPPNNSNPNNESEQTIAWAKQNNGIASMTWHWNAPANLVNSSEYPWWRGFYTQGTTFNLAGALANPSGSDYQLILRDIDAIAIELKKFQDAGVPVIWRPLHEAQGNANGTSGNGAWFWWGAHGPDNFKQLWRLMHDRLTNTHGLHNLIWEFTSSAAKTGYLNWYPGDDVVDMIGLDVYTTPTSSMSGEWNDILAQYNGRKMIALSESGTLPIPSALNNYNIGWSYFSLWQDGFLNDFSAAQVQALLNDSRIVTLNELPTLPWSNTAPAAGDFNHDGTVDTADYVIWRKSQGQTGWGLPADSNLDGRVDDADLALWRSRFGVSSGTGSAVPEPATWMLLLFGTIVSAARRRTGSFSDQ
jgi:mannan endo-1,4-beta-mannosidase